MFKKVFVTLLTVLASTLVAAPAQAAPPTLTTAPTYSISGAVAVENFIYTNGVGTWSGATSYKFAYYSCTSAHTNSLSLPGDCTEVQAESSNSRYDIEAADLGKHMMAVVIGVNADGETPHYMDTVGPVAGEASHSCPYHYTTTGNGNMFTTCNKTVEDNSGSSGPLYHLFSGSYTIELEGGDGGSATYGGNTVLGGDGARVAFNIATPVYTWYTSYWSMSYGPGGEGQDSQRWADSYCDDRSYTQGDGLYFSSEDDATDSFGGAVSRFTLSVGGSTVAYAFVGGGGGAGCNGTAGGNAGGVSTSASDLSTTDTVYVAYGEDGSDVFSGGAVGGKGIAETLAGGGSGGVGGAPSSTATLQTCFDGQKQSGGGGSPAGEFSSPYCGIFASQYYSGAAIAQHTYTNSKIWEGGAGGGGFYGTFDGSYKNLSGYAGGHLDASEDPSYGGGGGAGGASAYKVGTADDTYFTSLSLGQNTRTTTQGSVSISFPAQPIPDEPTITSITAGAGGTVVVTVEAAATGVVGPQFQVFQQGGTSTCTGIFDADTGVGTCTVSGLTAGTSYSFAPRAYNIFGYSARGPVQSITALGAAPVNTASPTVTGTARVASTLTANAGTWTGAAGSATYKWYVCDASVGFASTTLVSSAPYNCVEISGATSSTYQLTVSEQGKYVLVGETRVASDGAPGTKYSISTGAVAAAPSAPTIPYINFSGSRTSGSTLTVTTTTTGDPTLSYAWYSCTAAVNVTGNSLPAGCTYISGATSSSYLQTDNEIGKYVGLMITATNGVAPDYVASSGAPVVTNAGAPSVAAPTGVSASAGNASATVSWNAVSGATSYIVTSAPGGFVCSTSTTSCNVVGLTNGVAYTFTVVASDGSTSSSPSSASSSVTPSAGVPGLDAPTGVSASAGNATATISWNAVSGASTYRVTSNPGGLVCSTGTTSCQITGLTNGVSYTFTVIATNNDVGDSPSSSPSSAVTPSAGTGPAPSNGPSAPKAIAGNGSATLTWLAVVGAVAYKVTSLPAGAGCETITTTCTITGLVNGTNYFFTVYAVYANGSLSQPSALVGPITPYFDPNDPGQDPKLDFITPKSPVDPGTVKTTTGGKNTVTTASTSSGSHELKLNFGNPGNGLVKLSSFIEDSDSVLPLRKISGLKSLVLENNSLLKLRGDGYGEKTQIQFHLQSVSTGSVIYLGQVSVKKGGSFEFEYQLDGALSAGNYVLQINGFVFKNLEYKLRSTNVGTVVIDSAVQRVYFKPDSAKLTKTAKKEIADNLELLMGSVSLTMYSYTTGEVTTALQEVNKALAKKRATALKEYLVKLGVEESAVKIKVVGAVIPKNLSEPWRNRRVDIYIKL